MPGALAAVACGVWVGDHSGFKLGSIDPMVSEEYIINRVPPSRPYESVDIETAFVAS